MNRILSMLVALGWGVWFGAMVMLFVALAAIFSPPVDREAAGNFAARLFPSFERLQLICAAVCLLATAAWWIASRSVLKLILFSLFALASVAAVIETTTITPRIESLRVQGQRGTAEFERMHRLSTRVYLSGAVILLIAGLILPAAIRADGREKRGRNLPSEAQRGNGFHSAQETPESLAHAEART